MESKNVDPVTNTPVIAKKGAFPATVAEVIDDYKLVINRGTEHGIRKGQRVLIYSITNQEIKDPETGESLGFLELVRGTGKIIYLQERMSIIESDKETETRRVFDDNKPYYISWNRTETIIETIRVPFDNPQVGDQVKPI